MRTARPDYLDLFRERYLDRSGLAIQTASAAPDLGLCPPRLVEAPRRAWFDARGDLLPAAARVVEHLIGGMHTTARDRLLADALVLAWPDLRAHLYAGRDLQYRMIRNLAQAGVRQFLDIGCGIAQRGATHNVLAACTPHRARVVYVDVDPVTVELNSALLRDTAIPGAWSVLGDLADPASIVHHDEVTHRLDFGEPVAVLLFNVVQHLPADLHVTEVIGGLLDPCVTGSYVAIADLVTGAGQPYPHRLVDLYAHTPTALYPRSVTDLASGLAGLAMVDPGLVPAHRWKPGTGDLDAWPAPVLYGGLARLDRATAPSPQPGRRPAGVLQVPTPQRQVAR